MPPELLREIGMYYEQAPERERLQLGCFQLEFARTKEIIDRFLPEPPAIVLDVGGGPGRYAAWLAARGYEVHLVDPVPKLVTEARELDSRICSCQVGDARSLCYESCSAHAILLLGPLYHLTSHTDRQQALKEAYRVLAPGGFLFAATISRFASALDGLARDLFSDPEFSRIADRDLATGVHKNPTAKMEYFTTAQLHRPEELESEIVAAGFELQLLAGIEGPGWLFADFDQRWGDARRREDLLRIAKAFETEPSIRGVSAHLLGVAKRR